VLHCQKLTNNIDVVFMSIQIYKYVYVCVYVLLLRCNLIIIIIIIMFVYLTDDITRNLQSTSATQDVTRLYTEGLSSAKLLPHTAHSD